MQPIDLGSRQDADLGEFPVSKEETAVLARSARCGVRAGLAGGGGAQLQPCLGTVQQLVAPSQHGQAVAR